MGDRAVMPNCRHPLDKEMVGVVLDAWRTGFRPFPTRSIELGSWTHTQASLGGAQNRGDSWFAGGSKA
jgi:hypothetical protein